MTQRIDLVVGPPNFRKVHAPQQLNAAWKKYGRGENAGETGGERVNVFIYINGSLRGTVKGTYDYQVNQRALSDWSAWEAWWIGVKIRLGRRVYELPNWSPGGFPDTRFPAVIKRELRRILRANKK